MSCENELREAANEDAEDAERRRLGLQPPLTELVGKNLSVYFFYYRDNQLWYRAGSPRHSFIFPVPTNDANGGTFNAIDKSIYFMRWIRKHKDALELEERERRAKLLPVPVKRKCEKYEGCQGTGEVTDLTDSGSGRMCYCNCPAGDELKAQDTLARPEFK